MSVNTPKYRFILSGGGTGGHIYPAIAIADELKRRFPRSEFLFVGAKDRMEMEKVPKAGYAIKGLWISGLQRKLSPKNLLFPLKLIASLLRSRSILKKFKPHAVIGTGGFASGPLVQVAVGRGIPALIQEQNSFPGITNKLLGKKVNTICVAYEGLERYFPKDKIRLTGNPIRQDLSKSNMSTSQAKDKLKLSRGKHSLLVLGGSLGSRRINQLIEEHLDFFSEVNTELIWQCGSYYHEDYSRYNQREGVTVKAFIDDMKTAYAAADFIISRSGAISVSELCVVGKPVLFIPSPNVAEDHQTKNAKAISNKNAALYIVESDLNTTFTQVFTELINSKILRKKLSNNIKSLARTNATSIIVDEIEKMIS